MSYVGEPKPEELVNYVPTFPDTWERHLPWGHIIEIMHLWEFDHGQDEVPAAQKHSTRQWRWRLMDEGRNEIRKSRPARPCRSVKSARNRAELVSSLLSPVINHAAYSLRMAEIKHNTLEWLSVPGYASEITHV